MTFPSTAVTALILALIGWLQGDFFAGKQWVPVAVLVLDFAVKVIQVYWPSEENTLMDKRPSFWTVIWG
jgi:hypothetical protein